MDWLLMVLDNELDLTIKLLRILLNVRKNFNQCKTASEVSEFSGSQLTVIQKESNSRKK